MKLILTLTLVLLAQLCLAKTDKPAPTDEQVLKQISFEQLQAATNYMLFLVEAGLDPKLKTGKLKCAPSAETAQTWLSGSLHALSDEKMKTEAYLYKKSPASFKKRIQNCLKTCTCNAFQEMLESEDDELKKSSTYVSDHAFLEKEAKSETTEKSHACAQKYQGFCGSLLERYLKAN